MTQHICTKMDPAYTRSSKYVPHTHTSLQEAYILQVRKLGGGLGARLVLGLAGRGKAEASDSESTVGSKAVA